MGDTTCSFTWLLYPPAHASLFSFRGGRHFWKLRPQSHGLFLKLFVWGNHMPLCLREECPETTVGHGQKPLPSLTQLCISTSLGSETQAIGSYHSGYEELPRVKTPWSLLCRATQPEVKTPCRGCSATPWGSLRASAWRRSHSHQRLR